MKLLILEKGGSESPGSAYRGTERSHPFHADGFPEEHEVNRCFNWFISEGGELGVVHDLEKAITLVRMYRRFGLQPELEVIEVTDGTEPPGVGKALLGYDLSAGYNISLLAGLTLKQQARGRVPELSAHRTAIWHLAELADLEAMRYLNGVGLFSSPQEAARCLVYFDSIQKLNPGFYEIGHYSVVGVFLVPAS
jgi:hypothetical protein